MNVLFCASEAVPFAASGGLGDVIGSLPQALAKQNATIYVVLPLYQQIKSEYAQQLQFVTHFHVSLAWRNQYCGVFTLQKNGITYYFLDNEYYFDRQGLYGHYDDAERFAFFSKAILEMLVHIPIQVDIIHTHDWQTALVNLYLNIYYRNMPKFYGIKTVFTIHNIQYQGKYGMDIIDDVLGIPPAWKHHVEYQGAANFMKAAIEHADKVTTVSPTYAQEILQPDYSHGLHFILRQRQFKLWGILNGIDDQLYNPAQDKELAQTYCSKNFIKGKQACKTHLRDIFGLEQSNAPVLAMVTRFAQHKGLDLVTQIGHSLVEQGYQLVILGSGEEQYQQYFTQMARQYPGRVGVRIGFIPQLSRKIYAGSDMFLMPSHSEPCGLSQMIALRYGSIPIVRKTGGLKDTITDSLNGLGNGFVFDDYNAHSLYDCCMRALQGYQNTQGWNVLVKRAMECDFSWNNRAAQYMQLYNACLDLW